jgi:hypothetical protein
MCSTTRLRRAIPAAAFLACLFFGVAACSAGDTTSAADATEERAWSAELDGYVEWGPDEACAGLNDEGIATSTISEGTMGGLGAVSARFHHCPAEDGVYSRGTVMFTAADGDELRGEYDTVTDDFAADARSWPIEIAGGTGRFAGASGTVYLMSYRLDWSTDPPGWAGRLEGTISY